ALVTLDAEEIQKLVSEDEVPADPSAWPDDPKLRQMISDHVDEVNSKFARVEQVKKFRILPQDFAQETGELTPTMKVKRAVVADKYTNEIDELYEG
ncbi:MAG TPA: long-chain fatty acid--CoA ligase, partial [Solirubrobacterales bacterium]|nr:long-chain fatty acid--CoA ligase [Solirubrobacterales bacterium]